MKETLSKFVCDKDELKEKIDKRKRERVEMKNYKKPLLIFGTLVLVIGVIALPMLLKKDKKLQIEYTKYLSENKVLTETNKNYNKQIKENYTKYQNGEITEEQYFIEVDKIRVEKNKIKASKVALRTKYSITDNLDLKKVSLSKDKEVDKKLKTLFLESEQLNKQDDELEALEENLEKKYMDGKITKEEFKAQKAEIEKREDELEALEDAMDAKEEALEKEEEAKEKAEDEALEKEDAANDKAEEEKDKADEALEKEDVEKPEVEEVEKPGTV
ncbi:MAG: hypothetical protein RSB71_01915 [Bacilli bacterium]